LWLRQHHLLKRKLKTQRIKKLLQLNVNQLKLWLMHQQILLPPINCQSVYRAQLPLIQIAGSIVISLLGNKAPITVTQMTTLARGGYFDDTSCHRLTTQGLFVLQCGDPTATGTGGPNFTYRDENLPQASANNYPAGTVAMANSGPGTNGSQFFLVFADTTLGPNYTIGETSLKG
jgi:peptidyl-prolyl cis-trans isomerase B (cyclophilin B)